MTIYLNIVLDLAQWVSSIGLNFEPINFKAIINERSWGSSSAESLLVRVHVILEYHSTLVAFTK